jgi:hypothetical protein
MLVCAVVVFAGNVAEGKRFLRVRPNDFNVGHRLTELSNVDVCVGENIPISNPSPEYAGFHSHAGRYLHRDDLCISQWQISPKNIHIPHLSTTDKANILWSDDGILNKWFLLKLFFGVAKVLADDGILYAPDVPPDTNKYVAYSIQDWVLSFLKKHPELVGAPRPPQPPSSGSPVADE